jgi:hypothetical protein
MDYHQNAGYRALGAVVLGVAVYRHQLPFSAYLAILFKVHRMSLLGSIPLVSIPCTRGCLSKAVPCTTVCL